MTYEELMQFVDECIEKSEHQDNLLKCKSKILASLTVNDNNNNSMEIKDDMLDLWENQIGTPSELLLGTRYIRIKDSMISFVELALCSGLLDALISANSISGITLSVGAGVLCSLLDLFTNVSKLDDLDFCIYMQAVCHFKEHKCFTKKDLLEWFPHGAEHICNMQTSKWDCEFIDHEQCRIISDNGIDEALDSLMRKNLLTVDRTDKQYRYKFPY